MRNLRSMAVLFSICVVLTGCNVVDVAVTESSHASPSHTVFPAFASLYQNLGGEAALGLPITGVLTEQGRTVQYWAAVRMEVNSQTGVVSLSKIGDEMGRRTSPISAQERGVVEARGLTYFAETGHSLSFIFADEYLRLGGPSVLGRPISEFTFEEGRFVQYFECARLDWYSELGPEVVRFGPLAQAYLTQRTETPPAVLAQAPRVTVEPLHETTELRVMSKPTSTVIPTPVPLPLRVAALVSEATLARGREQTLHVWVVDAGHQAMRGVPVRVVVRERTQDRVLDVRATDSTGCATWSFSPNGSPKGYQVFVDAVATWQGIEYMGRTSYMVW